MAKFRKKDLFDLHVPSTINFNKEKKDNLVNEKEKNTSVMPTAKLSML